jgi:cytochrome c551
MSKSKVNFFCAVIFACASFSELSAVADTTQLGSALTANPVYEKNCAKCHGKTAEGRHFGGPALISEKAASASVDDLSNIINNGKGRMPKYANKLTTDEINALVEQIRALNKK